MIAIDQKLVDKFIKETEGVIDNTEELYKILINRYLDEGLDFHGIFLRSRIYLKSDRSLLKRLAFGINKSNLDYKQDYTIDFIFLDYVMSQHELYLKQCENIIKSWNNKIYAEDLLFFMEYLLDLIETGRPFFGMENNKKLTKSHLEHMISSIDVLIDLINKVPVKFSLREPLVLKKQCEELFQPLSYLKKTRDIFDEISVCFAKPSLGGELWYLQHTCGYWRKMEIYRDLNYYYSNRYEETQSETIDIMRRTGALKAFNEDLVWIDLARDIEFDEAREVHQKYKVLYPVYGGIDTEFIFQNKTYSIKMLISLYEAIRVFVRRLDEDYGEEKSSGNNIRLIGRKKLLRLLNLKGTVISELIDLMVYDFDIHKDKPQTIHWKPLLKRDNVFFIVPSVIFNESPEKILDKILSNEVEVIYDEGKGNGRKGIVFESHVKVLLESLDIDHKKVSRNNKREIPEFDGLFTIDEFVFIYEAKAAIKPESMLDMYNQLNSILYKAKEQLDLRVSILLNDKEKLEYIENETGISFQGKQLAPFILVNNPMFAGYRELNNKELNISYPVVYINDLKNILENRSIAVWKYNEQKDSYRRTEKGISMGAEVWEFMIKQFDFMESTAEPIFVYGHDRISYQVSKSPEINFEDW